MKTISLKNFAVVLAATLPLACGQVNNPAQQATSLTQTDGQWTWIDMPEAVCGNGNATGFGVSSMSDSHDLVIYFEGGGACRSYVECYVLKTADYVLSGYNKKSFQADLPGLEDAWLPTSRTIANAPFADKNLAYFPYCTGDLHAGHNVVTYRMARQPMHHVGGDNVKLFMLRLAAAMPQVDHIWLTGFSAGGLATLLNHDLAQSIFPHARIDILDDSGIAFSDAPAVPPWWKINMPTCSGCAANMSLLPVYYAQNHPDVRVGFMSYEVDSVLPFFYGLLDSQFSTDIAGYTRRLDDVELPNLHYFIASGLGHGVMNNPNQATGGMAVSDWVDALTEDANSWVSAKPPFF